MRTTHKKFLILLVPFLLALVAACGDSSGSDTNCSAKSCVVTFDRGVDAKASLLGVEVALVDVSGDSVVLDVAGQRVTVPANGETQSGPYTVRVLEVTEKNVKIELDLTG